MTQAQARIRGAVTRNKKEKLTALLHHVGIDCLRWAFFNLKKRADPASMMTWEQYAETLTETSLISTQGSTQGAYRALPSRRKYIPKADGRQRPLGIAAIEDKIVQAAVVAILTPIYEAEFLGFSYGFRPGRSQHDALDAFAYGIKHARSTGSSTPTSVVLRHDQPRVAGTVRGTPDRRSKDHPPDPEVVEGGCVGRRPGGSRRRRVRRRGRSLRRSWPTCTSITSTISGSSVAQTPPHRRYDRRAVRGRRWSASSTGAMRSAFLNDLKDRLAQFALSLHPEKTRLIEFGKFAAERREEAGQRRTRGCSTSWGSRTTAPPGGRHRLPTRAQNAAQADAGQTPNDR